MAKTRRRRYRRKSGRWAPNIREISEGNLTLPPAAFAITQTLAQNPTQQDTFVSQSYTVKNVEISFVFEGSYGQADGAYAIEDLCAYIMYVPQGYFPTGQGQLPTDFNNLHPEWILNYKFLGSPTGDVDQGFQPIRMKTRLARKLQTGDRLVLFLKGNNASSSEQSIFELHGLIRWWTKAN